MESADHTCLVCHEHVDYFAIGRCDHPICYKCSTRMRALCEQFYCPICRADLPEVFFLTTKEKFGEMPMRKFIMNRKLKIQFENQTVREKFEELLEHKCRICQDRYPEKSFKALRDHMRRVHTLFYCDLCLELKIFSSERKVYNRQDLATHRRVGDKDDKSYKGHPLCQFCEERYLDKDELYKHLRKDHYFCHFCESLGSQEFYNDYQVLKDHFRSDHYLCEEGDCFDAEFTNAFRTDIDFKGHQAQYHSKATNKLQSRQERKLNIDINLAPRPNSRPHRGGRDSRDEFDGARRMGPRHQGNRGGGKHTKMSNREKDDLDRAIQASLSTMSETDMKRDLKDKSSSDDKKPGVELSQNEENFPTLGGKTDEAPTSSSSTISSSSSTTVSSKSSLADRFAMSNSMSVQHGTLNDFPTLSTSVSRSDSPMNVPSPRSGLGSNHVSVYKQKPVEEDFPELPTGGNTKKINSGTWVKTSNSGNERDKHTNKHSKKVHVSKPSVQTMYDVCDFPTLEAPSNSSVNKKWFSSSKDPPPDNAKTSKKTNNNNNESSNIIDRFSPINVPDSPKADKNKNKKKKKKDKVTEMKTETKTNGGSLPGNNSLDDIASLLMSDSSSAKSDSVAQNGVDEAPVPKLKQEKSKNKKKVDKVEKKLEEEKSVDSKFEELNLYGGLDSASSELIKSEPVKFTIAAEDYPALGSNSGPKKPPPGFKGEVDTTKSSAPPGFLKTSSYQPPPGFGSFSVTTAPVPEKNIIPMSTDLGNFVFAQPNDFQERNRQLIGAIQTYCDRDPLLFSDFKHISGEFRRSEISARQYYQRCEEILGEKNFSQVFPELLALLPDIDKQQELLSIFMSSSSLKKDDKVIKISGKSRNAKGAWLVTQSGFLSCPTCRQVLSRKDYNSHITGHDLNADFPSLSDNKVPAKFNGRSWVKS